MRWERVLRCMDEGLTLKRRVIESLRPTLLDNVGLDAALRWLVDETLRRQGIVCEEQYPETMPELTPDSRIAVFRVVQECLMNILKHAKAKSVLLRVTTDGDRLSVIVRDDGVGIDEGRIETPQSHGLLGMRHRIEALDGNLTRALARAGRRNGIELLSAARAHPEDGDQSMNKLILMIGAARPRRLRQERRPGRRRRRLRRAIPDAPPIAPAIIPPDEVANPTEPPSYEVGIASAAADAQQGARALRDAARGGPHAMRARGERRIRRERDASCRTYAAIRSSPTPGAIPIVHSL